MPRADKSIFLFADSQLLFARENKRLVLQRVRDELEGTSPIAAYIGASNGDDERFFNLFRAAMQGIDVTLCKMINSCFAREDQDHLASADIILLAGGEVERGWKIFDSVGIKEVIRHRHEEGVILVGVSAGAVQLGRGAYVSEQSNHFVPTFGIVPLLVGAHEEQSEWRNLCRAVAREGGNYRGVGLPAGAGIVYHSDHTVEPLRRAAHEFSMVAGTMRHTVLFPPSVDSPAV